jgi:hypothetical protein
MINPANAGSKKITNPQKVVTPACDPGEDRGGVQCLCDQCDIWIPAFAGMTFDGKYLPFLRHEK